MHTRPWESEQLFSFLDPFTRLAINPTLGNHSSVLSWNLSVNTWSH